MTTFGQTRLPGEDARLRRNADVYQGDIGIVAADGAITVDPATGALSVAVSAPIAIASNAVSLNIGSGLGLSASNLVIELATNPGLEFVSGDLAVQLNGSTLTKGASGLSVTNPWGLLTITAVQTGAYTAAAGELVRADPSGGAFTVTLPAASTATGQPVIVKNVTSSTNAITVDGDGSETIDGAATATVNISHGVLHLVSDGTEWWSV